jgi:hypothetical protein
VALLGHFADGLQLLVRATLRVLICTRLNWLRSSLIIFLIKEQCNETSIGT